MIAHGLEWTCASPLWTPNDRVAMRRPTILSFDNDLFIDELGATLAKEPASLRAKIAVYESHRQTGSSLSTTLKLYQPAHGRHYLVAANLVCQIPGIPDRRIDKAKDESISFVLRRITATGAELAWVITRPGMRPDGEWHAVPSAGALVAGEQLYPMSAFPYQDKTRTRRLNIGVIPAGAREQFEAAEIGAAPSDVSSEGDPRLGAAEAQVTDTLALLQAPLPSQPADVRAAQELQEKQATAFLLLDLADWLALHAPALWSALQSRQRPTAPSARTVYDLLDHRLVDTAISGSWRDAMVLAVAERPALLGDVETAPTLTRNARRANTTATELRSALANLVVELGPVPVQTIATSGTPRIDTTGLRYVIRAVFRRPRCGALHRDVVSDPSVPFVLAAFYDFDAPVRPVRISLPVDTSIAGLRKFKKSVSFVISKSMREQLSRSTKLKKAIDGDIGSAKTFDLGEICSFSLPVITMCALIVLMIFISLLNIVFWWVPFLKFCIPIPQPKVPR